MDYLPFGITPSFALFILLSMSSCGSEGGKEPSASLAALSSTAAQSNITGLDFPGSAGVFETMRFKFVRPDQNGLPAYGLLNSGATYIFKTRPRQQTGYYTAFFWGNDDGVGTINSTFLWDHGFANTYYGMHPYPPGGSTGTTHNWEISVDQLDAQNGFVVKDVWYTQVARVWVDPDGSKRHEFYWNWPNTDASHMVTHTSPANYNNENPPSPALTFGDAPWNPGHEVWCGILRGFQIYATKLSLADIQSEIDQPLSTSAGAANVWYLNLNPTPDDISDKSGRGHHPVWVGNERPALYTENASSPTASNDSYATQSGLILSVDSPGVLMNDTGPAGVSLRAVLVSGPTNGALTLNPDGSFNYFPNAGFTGSDSFLYQASSGPTMSNVATATITVATTNRAPVPSIDSYSGQAGSTLTVPAPGVLSNDVDPDGGSLTALLVTGASNGALTLNPNGSFTYIPNTGFSGADSFSYRASDGTLSSPATTVSLTVTSGNQPPVAGADMYVVQAGSTLTVAAPGVLSNDADPDGNSLTALLTTGTTNGTLTLNPNGSFTYIPTSGFSGSDSFSYRASDGQLQSNSVTVSVTVSVAGTSEPFTVFPMTMTYTGTVNGPNQDAGIIIKNNLATMIRVKWGDHINWLIATSGDTVDIPPGGTATIIHTASMGDRRGTWSGTATVKGAGLTKRISVILKVN